MHQLCQVHSEGQVDQEVRDPQHRRGRRRQRYLRRLSLRSVRLAQAVRQAPLLRVLRHSLQGRPWTISGGEKGQDAATKIQAQAELDMELETTNVEREIFPLENIVAIYDRDRFRFIRKYILCAWTFQQNLDLHIFATSGSLKWIVCNFP